MVANFEQINNQCVNFYNSELHTWKGLNFRSKSEIKIAEELDRRGIFFLPNCAGRVNGKSIEADFLICYEGLWGILEVDGEEYHKDKSKDSTRDNLIRDSNIGYIRRYTAKECYNNPEDIVSDFLVYLKEESSVSSFLENAYFHLDHCLDIKLLRGYHYLWDSYKSAYSYKDCLLDAFFELNFDVLDINFTGIICSHYTYLKLGCFDSREYANQTWRMLLTETLDNVLSDYSNLYESLNFIHRFNTALQDDYSFVVENETRELFTTICNTRLGSLPFSRWNTKI